MASGAGSGSAAAPTFDPTLYPRTYKISGARRAFALPFGAVTIAACLVGTWYFGSGRGGLHGPQEATFLASISLLFGLGLALMIVRAFKLRVVLTAETIEVEGFGQRQLRRDAIAGRRSHRSSTATLVLVPQRKDQKKLRIPTGLQTDGAFDAWIITLPDLDAAELRESEAEIAANLEFGATSEERLARLARAAKVSKVLNLVAIFVGVWGLFWPHPYWGSIAVLATLPWVAMMLMVQSRGLYRVTEGLKNAHPTLISLYFVPASVLTLRATLDFQFLDWQQAMQTIVICGVGLVLIARASNHGAGSWVLIILWAGLYAYGAVAEANGLFDRSRPELFRVKVLDKHVVHGSHHTTFYLRLEPWGPRQASRDAEAAAALYNSINPGDTVCVHLHAGALKIPWYFVLACRSQPPDSPPVGDYSRPNRSIKTTTS